MTCPGIWQATHHLAPHSPPGAAGVPRTEFQRWKANLSTYSRPERQRRAGTHSAVNVPQDFVSIDDLDAVPRRVGPGSAALRALSGDPRRDLGVPMDLAGDEPSRAAFQAGAAGGPRTEIQRWTPNLAPHSRPEPQAVRAPRSRDGRPISRRIPGRSEAESRDPLCCQHAARFCFD